MLPIQSMTSDHSTSVTKLIKVIDATSKCTLLNVSTSGEDGQSESAFPMFHISNTLSLTHGEFRSGLKSLNRCLQCSGPTNALTKLSTVLPISASNI